MCQFFCKEEVTLIVRVLYFKLLIQNKTQNKNSIIQFISVNVESNGNEERSRS